ncbi:MAG: YitT family protein [Bacteroidetes bacterium]|nr:YitT family protein [Bacteroidota bacterium]MBS1592306.1 YitT family protein [Bacteroidota bacterium]
MAYIKQAIQKHVELSAYGKAKKIRKLRITIRTWIKDILLICLGIGSAAFGLESFLLPNSFIDGGATGLSLLISEITKLHLPLLLVLVNIPFVILGYTTVGKQFAIKTACAICGLAICMVSFPFPEITHDKLLVSLFGGFFLGAGIGLSVRGGAVLDGTEVLAIYLSRKIGGTIGDVVIVINVLIFSAAAYFLSIETAMYAMITYLSASKTLDFIIEGIEEYTGITIISTHFEEIIDMIVNKMGRGVTVYSGKRGYGKHGHVTNSDIIFIVITRLEISKLKVEVEKIDPNAFVVMSSIKDTKGGMVKKRPLH